ncbi:MAG TPA: c-type cytochrome [Burkholderiales bacterium]|nr:c-type cytochrome [Burkholderiales bacterium]
MNFRLILAIAAFAGTAFAPTLLAQSVVKGDAAKGQEIVGKVCAACHGPDGNSPLPVNPSLAGQHPEYIYKQLGNFKSKDGKPAERNNPVMAGMVATLSDDDMKNVAAYYSSQTPRPHAARDPELVKQGQRIFRGGIAAKSTAACASCHSPNGAGLPAQYPRVSGQHAEYIAAQLKAFRAGERNNDFNSMMRTVAGKLSDREIAAVSEYIAGLR